MSRVRVTLSEAEMAHLGITGDSKLNRYRLDKDQRKKIIELRGCELPVKGQNIRGASKKEDAKPFVFSAIAKDGTLLDIDKYCDVHGLPREDVKSYKLVTHTGIPYYNTQFKEHDESFDPDSIDFEGIVAKYVKSVPSKPRIPFPTPPTPDWVDRLIYTDVHIGMTTNESGYSLYGGNWDEQEQISRCEKIISKVIANKKSNVLYIDDLGDFMDGFEGKTTRKGHDLPQNMDSETAFDVGLRWKVMMTDSLFAKYDKIICHNVCNDNHAGPFGYMVNAAFKRICEAKYDNVEVINERRFIFHYSIGKHCFVLCHGKDGQALKFGFKPHLDPKHQTKIEDYIRVNKIKEDYIEFSKGDSHQMLFDYATSDVYDYMNYGAVSPASEWVQTNFKRGRSGFVLQHINTTSNEKVVNPFYFEWSQSK